MQGIWLVSPSTCAVEVLAWGTGLPASAGSDYGHAAVGWSWTGLLLVVAKGRSGRRCCVYEGTALVQAFVAAEQLGLALASRNHSAMGGFDCWSPDGRWIIIPHMTSSEFCLWDIPSGQTPRKFPGGRALSSGKVPVWEPSSERCLFIMERAEVAMVDPTSGRCQTCKIAHYVDQAVWAERGVAVCTETDAALYTVLPGLAGLVLHHRLDSQGMVFASVAASFDGGCVAVRLRRDDDSYWPQGQAPREPGEYGSQGTTALSVVAWDTGVLQQRFKHARVDHPRDFADSTLAWAANGDLALLARSVSLRQWTVYRLT